MDDLEFGKKIAQVHTVFLYKVNVAIGALLLFINIQFLVAAMVMGDDEPWLFMIRIILVLFSLGYGLIAINAYRERIIIYEQGIEIKSLFRYMRFSNRDVENVDFFRSPSGQKYTTLQIRGENKPLQIRLSRYAKSDLLIACFQTIKY
ncbi:MAG: hypothetical protein FWB71_03035 [Defluviitaleaceae bacterium]|nr:hypothetical protein [Defluviitaleaceae bacterium]